jgi:rubrerythrin
MTALSSVNEILDFAISEEQAAHDFYVKLAGKLAAPALRQVFEGFALEELGHKAKLQAVKDGKKLMTAGTKVADLKIGDYLVDVGADDPASLDYQQALIIAMKKEEAAMRLYKDLAGRAGVPEIKDLLLGLAQEEAKHKLRFEVEYDEYILREN